MREETRLIYHCEYCNKISLRKSSMLRHEKACKQNPNVKIMCFDCAFQDTLQEEFDYNKRIDEEREEPHYISFTFQYCRKRNIKMIPHKAFANEFLNDALRGKYDKIMPTINSGCLEYEGVNSSKVIIEYDALLDSGNKKQSMQDYIGAIEDYNKAMEHDYNEIWVYDCCIEAYKLLADYEGARKMEERRNIAYSSPI